MTERRWKNTGILISTVFFIMLAWFLILAWKESPVEESFGTETVSEWKTTWHTETESRTSEELPAYFSCDENGKTVITTTIPENIKDYGNSLCFRASQSEVRIWIDGILLLEQGFLDSGKNVLGREPSSSWVMLRLTSDCEGKKLQIELYSPYKDYQGLLKPVYVGTKSALLSFIIRSYGWRLLAAVLLIIIGIFLIIVCVVYTFRKVFSMQILMLGIFGILTGIWMFGESQMLQFFTGKLVWWYNLTLVSLHLIPLPLLKIIEDLPGFRYKKICRFQRWLAIIYLGMLILLQILDIQDFMELLNDSLVLFLLMCVITVFLIYWDYHNNNNKKMVSMVIALSVFGGFACVELVVDLIRLEVDMGRFLCIGVLFFYVIIVFDSIRRAMSLYSQGLRTLYYRNLSYVDQMTDCMNRRSFTEREKEWTAGGEDVLVMADLNDLKKINDSIGHYAGDAYIKNCAEALREVFGAWGVCYRMGGDEFLFWGSGLTESEIDVMNAEFHSLVRKKCSEISPLCCVATGIARIRPEDRTLEDAMKRADENMYENKRKLKEILNTGNFDEKTDEGKNENKADCD